MRRAAAILAALAACESAPAAAPDLCDVAWSYCVCEADAFEACLEAATTDEAAQACGDMVE